MEPNHNTEYSPGAELPQLEQSDGQIYGNEYTVATPEVRGQQSPITSVGGASSLPSVPIATSTSLPPNDQPTGASGPFTNASTSTLTADDSDLIEKEWVLKAKAIVMQTKSDPRAQNEQMNGIKADYLKKRYNKDLKVGEN